ncbi:DNA ligase D [Pseudoduganella sp. DS3]|uniref:DNA ligase (ATP) n=1 Tax=Pseudoduganella guangdongensis TaxID=2692179 RepID=A0A6N9HQL0_9BURK|nr:DNA ligase D [Pseudoduganella guangdongensis]MYN05122.1 DNA ligase D [Pseudoduganella guangdongensis]
MKDALKTYKAKRNFSATPEPAEGGQPGQDRLGFVIQKHWATRLHYDFRLELDGTMKSWAVPKGPSYDTRDKRMAVQVEDHPIAYNEFEGTIPEKQYGAGKVIIWDRGTWEPLEDPRKGYRAGKLVFLLHGHKMHGRWALVRMRGKGEDKEPWLLIKEKDQYVRPADEFSVVDEMPDSVKHLGPAAVAATAPAAAAAPLPESLAPELATLADSPPAAPEDWLFEVKYDGYRLLARIEGGDIRLLTRNGNDWTHKLEPLQAALAGAGLPDGWYDGEIVVHNAQGRPDFGLLQQAFDGRRTKEIVYFMFDAPYLAGEDLRALPLEQRRARLQAALEHVDGDTIRLSTVLQAPPEQLLAAACEMGLEGVIGKRRDSAYTERRSRDWIKLKCAQRQEFVIGGYTDPQGSRTGIGSLLLGVYGADGALHYAGNVGTGFNDKTLRDLALKLKRLAADASPFAPGKAIARRAHWVKPQLVAEVSFGEWTHGGSVRHAVFQGLRKDKRAAEIRREEPAPIEENTVHSKLPASLKVTNPDRLVDQASGLKKIDLLRYYALMADLLLEHTRGRPVSLVRAPDGVGGELFFQKHADVSKLKGLKEFPRELDPEHPPMLEVGTTEALLSAAQFNVIELHTQNALGRTYEKPNRIVFDLDPGSGVEWTQVQEAAQLMHGFLDELGLPCFLKTSGGKGLHVVVPIKPYYDWDTVKAFSKQVVEHMAAILPERFAAKSGPRNRVGKIFIDYLRNGRGATTVSAWSARARPGLGISVPVGWDELASLRGGDHWTVATAHTRLDAGNTPWADYAKAAVGLAPAMKAVGQATAAA